jgi:hypothetical protein
MKTCGLSLCFALLSLIAGPVFGQEAAGQTTVLRRDHDLKYQLPEVSPNASPEIWLYTQEVRRYDNPELAIRKKAELKTAQRMQRISAMKWFGQSNSRPYASATPFMDYYSPYWAGNGTTPFAWVGNETGRAVSVHQYYSR